VLFLGTVSVAYGNNTEEDIKKIVAYLLENNSAIDGNKKRAYSIATILSESNARECSFTEKPSVRLDTNLSGCELKFKEKSELSLAQTGKFFITRGYAESSLVFDYVYFLYLVTETKVLEQFSYLSLEDFILKFEQHSSLQGVKMFCSVLDSKNRTISCVLHIKFFFREGKVFYDEQN
jgi:hypothetical protein